MGERFEIEARLRRFDGAYRWFVIRALPLLNPDGRVSEWIGSCTDIDDLKRSEQTLLRSNEELKQFAYAAAHDLQEPLRNVAVSVGMLRRYFGAQLDDAAAHYMEASIEGAQRLHAMVKDLLTFSTILDTAQPRYARCSLREVLSRVVAGFSSKIGEMGAVVEWGELPDVAVDENHAHQIFHLLLDNSLKYRHGARTARIEVSTSPHEAGCLVTVRDNGLGFDPAYAQLIFRVFKRLHQRSAYAGNGIGLAVCERIIAHYGGRIWAEGWPERGAAFHFTLPGCVA